MKQLNKFLEVCPASTLYALQSINVSPSSWGLRAPAAVQGSCQTLITAAAESAQPG